MYRSLLIHIVLFSILASGVAQAQKNKQENFTYGKALVQLTGEVKSRPNLLCSNCNRPEPAAQDCQEFEKDLHHFSCDGKGEIINPFTVLSSTANHLPKISQDCKLYLLKKAQEDANKLLAETEYKPQAKAILESAQIVYFMESAQLNSFVTVTQKDCGYPQDTIALAREMQGILMANYMTPNQDMLNSTILDLKVSSLDKKLEAMEEKTSDKKALKKIKGHRHNIELYYQNKWDMQLRSTLEEDYCKAVGKCRLLGGTPTPVKNDKGKVIAEICVKGGIMYDASCLNIPGDKFKEFNRKMDQFQTNVNGCFERLGPGAANLKDRFNQHMNTPLPANQATELTPRTQICCGSNHCAQDAFTKMSKREYKKLIEGEVKAMATQGGDVQGTLYLTTQSAQAPQKEFDLIVFHEMLHRLGLSCGPLHNMANAGEYADMKPDENGQCFPQGKNKKEFQETSMRWVASGDKCIPDPTMSPDQQECANNLTKKDVEIYDPVYACHISCFKTDHPQYEKAKQTCLTFMNSEIKENDGDPMKIEGLTAEGKKVNMCTALKGM